jgi:putative hydrolase of the HAD superfamily
VIKAILFDFGGVIAEEGFREGLKEIARKNGISPEEFFSFVSDFIYTSGYLLGRAAEKDFWDALRKEMSIKGSDEELRREILDRFIIRREIMKLVEQLKKRGYIVGILSDQTNWLDELDKRDGFLKLFDYVFNSYHLHKAKRDPTVFSDVAQTMGLRPEEVLFIDDNPENLRRAEEKGVRTILFTEFEDLLGRLKEERIFTE